VTLLWKRFAQVVAKSEMPKEISPGKIRRMVHGNDGVNFVKRRLINRTTRITNRSILTALLLAILV
jgi:hypothetical protein